MTALIRTKVEKLQSDGLEQITIKGGIVRGNV